MDDYELTPLQFSRLRKVNIIRESYDRFEAGLLNEELFFLPQNTPIEKPKYQLYEEKSELFWHFVSFGEDSYKEYFEQLYPPCINTDFQTFCNECTIGTPTIMNLKCGNRIFCPYRSAFVHAVREIIDMCNEIVAPGSQLPEKASIRNNIKVWYTDDNEHKGEIKISILYSKKKYRYLIVLRSCNKMSILKFITAHPIFEGTLYGDYLDKYKTAKKYGKKILGP